MRKTSLVVAVWVALFFSCCSSADILLEDDAGHELRFTQPVARIITLAPHLAELVFAAGAGELVVGTAEWSNTPAAAKSIPRIGDGFRIDAERLVALQPDIVLAWGGGTPQNTIQQLERLGMRVAVLAPRRLADIPRQLEWIGRLSGREGAANETAEEFRVRLASFRKTHAERLTLSVFYQINDPLVFTIGGRHTISEAIEVCGGRNVFIDLASGAHAVGREAVISRNPDVILVGAHTETLSDAADWQRWPALRAVQAGNVFVMDAELIARATPRILDGVEQICGMLEVARENLAS